MSFQVFLQAKILGIEEFLLSAALEETAGCVSISEEKLLRGRSRWIGLLSEILPRALLAELGLAKVLLGSSGGGQFLVVLPSEAVTAADDLLSAAGRQMESLSGGHLKLVWVTTENLGDWSVVRKRLNEEMRRRRGTPAAHLETKAFEPITSGASPPVSDYFSEELTRAIHETDTIGWSPEAPGMVRVGAGKHTWNVSSGLASDAIPIARHVAPSDDGQTPADLQTLASRAEGRAIWGFLRGDVDNLGIRLRRVHTIEEHVQLSLMYKQFFAGELEVLCSLPEFWQKVAVLYTGGDDFGVYGAWDALIPLAREIQRLFRRFSEENLKDFPGPEGKTISMALSLAPDPSAALAAVYEEAGERLEFAKSTDKDCFQILGHTLEWRQLAEAAETRETMQRLASQFNCSPSLLFELGGFYRRGAAGSTGRPTGHQGQPHLQKPWRFHRHLNRFFGNTKDRQFLKLRAELTAEMTGRGAQVKLRPAGHVALEWTRLLTEG